MPILRDELKIAAFWSQPYCLSCRERVEDGEPAEQHLGHQVVQPELLLQFVDDVVMEDEEGM